MYNLILYYYCKISFYSTFFYNEILLKFVALALVNITSFRFCQIYKTEGFHSLEILFGLRVAFVYLLILDLFTVCFSRFCLVCTNTKLLNLNTTLYLYVLPVIFLSCLDSWLDEDWELNFVYLTHRPYCFLYNVCSYFWFCNSK